MGEATLPSPIYFFTTMDNSNTLNIPPGEADETAEKLWYAIRVTYNRELKVKADLDERGIENFVPMQYKHMRKGCKIVKKLVPTIHNLIFVLIDKKSMVEYKATTTLPIRYIMDREKHVPMVIPRRQMDNFIAVAGSYDEQLIYIENDPGTLKKGDKVRVLGGIFEGAEGTLMRIKGDRRVVVSIPGVIAVATANIHASLLEKIKE